MRALTVLLAILSLSTAAMVSAEIVELPVAALVGEYQSGPSHQAEFTLGNPPAVVHSVSFRVSGSTEVGELCCDDGCQPYPTEVSVGMRDDAGNYWLVGELLPLTPGAFGWTNTFQTWALGQATWDFLLDGTGNIYVSAGMAPSILGCTVTFPLPRVWIDEAVLVVDGEFPVQVESSTWGRLKVLFR